MQDSDRRARLREFMMSPIGLGVIAIIIVAIIILVITTIAKINNDNDAERDLGYSEVDAASGETVWFYPPTGGGDLFMSDVLYVGVRELLLENGLEYGQLLFFEDSIEQYAKDIDIGLQRVSYLKDSYHLPRPYIFEFKVVLNIDEILLSVSIDASSNRKNVLGTKIRIMDEDNVLVYESVVDESNLCEFTPECIYSSVDAGDE